MTKNHGLVYLLIILFWGCNSQINRLAEISYLSQIDIPPNSEISNYHDNLETAVVYKIRLHKNEVENFIKVNNFNALDTLDKHYFEYHDILNGFVKKERIIGKNLKICQKYSTSMILNEEQAIVWGITNYPVTLPDSVVAKKPW